MNAKRAKILRDMVRTNAAKLPVREYRTDHRGATVLTRQCQRGIYQSLKSAFKEAAT